MKTNQTGTSRTFFSPPLRGDQFLTYEIRVRWKEKGRPVEQTQLVMVHPGERLNVSFPPVPATGMASAPERRVEEVAMPKLEAPGQR